MKRISTTLALALAVAAAAVAASLTVAPAANAAVVDVDTAYAATAGASVSGSISWTTYAGNGSYSLTVRDTSADGHCARLYARALHQSGRLESWTVLGEVCGTGRSGTFTGTLYGPTSDPIVRLDLKIYRTGVGNSAIYSCRPGGN